MSQQDALEARKVGEKAVEFSTDKQSSGSVAIKRTGDYSVEYILTPLDTVARKTKSMPKEFYDAQKSMVTEEFIKYAKPLVGDLPVTEILSAPKVESKLK